MHKQWMVPSMLVGALVVGMGCCAGAAAAEPDHPIITEVYTDPVGLTDGPVGRDPVSLHQGFIEIYLPPASALNASLQPFKDAMRLAFYEIEGDSSSSGVNLVNYRLDLPTFDLDPGNGITALPRPPSGVVVLGWVDYAGNPPTGFAVPETALIAGGLTAPPADFTFIAMNGLQFGGTTTFTSIAAESLIDMPGESVSGIIQNGSAAYLLVNRDLPGYAELCDDQHAIDCTLGADPQLRHPSPVLPGGNILGLGSFLDGLAGNDHPLFRIRRQPYDAPTGDDIDLETVLPLGGAYALLVPQVPEVVKASPNAGVANGYARVYVDVAKTTENASPADDDPVCDATFAYRHVRNDGPFFASPGKAPKTTSPPELSVAADIELVADVLKQTVGFAGLLCANVGGDFGIDMTVDSVGPSSNAGVASFALGTTAVNVPGQAYGFPSVAVTPGPAAVDGALATTTVSVSASNTFPPPDPAVDPTPQVRTLTARILDPTTGQNDVNLPFQTTVFAAVQTVPNTAALNEILTTDFGAFLTANFPVVVQDTKGNGPVLMDPTFDLTQGCMHSGCLCDPMGLNCAVPQMVASFPQVAGEFINFPGPDGILATADDLMATVANSAEQIVHGTYDESLFVTDFGTCAASGLLCSLLAQDCADLSTCLPTLDGLRAVRFNHPDTFTFGGTFSPSEILHFADSVGRIDNQRTALANATTTRTFELAIVDTNVRQASTPALPVFENGLNDDFGIVVEVLDVEPTPTPPVNTGDFVFLSLSGGLEGADIDGLAFPPGDKVINLIYLDLDNLHDVLGVISIEAIYLVDGGGNTGTADFIDVFSLNPITRPPTITQWRSCGTHGTGVGEACLTIPDDGTFGEPRLCADRLVVTFDSPIDPLTVLPQNVTLVGNDVNNLPVDLTGVAVSVTTQSANTELVITFSPILPDVARYSVSLANLIGANGLAAAGDMNRVFTVIRGDVNQSLHVTNADLGFVRFFRDQPTNPVDPAQPFQVAADVNCSGGVSNADLGAVRFFRDAGSDARFITNP